MAGELGDVKRVESRLIEYQSKAKAMSVGVNYAALDSERQRQEDLLRELRELEKEMTSPPFDKTQLPQLASNVGVDLDLNAKCLKYLTGISELEGYVADITAHFAERSVELSNPNVVHSAIYPYKTLTGNVGSCWDYVDQLASLAQIHLKSAAEYHQFFHEANELESKMERQLAIAKDRQELNPGRLIYKETSRLANEIREQLDVMRHLWDRSKALVERSTHILPMRLRLGGVAEGLTVGTPTERPVMVRAMTGLTGSNYSIQQGEHLRLIDNREDARLWKVQTSTGIAEVPSVCFWLTGNDLEATNRAIEINRKCQTVWLNLLERNQQRLYENFTMIMTELASEEHVYCTNYDALSDLLQDMRVILLNSALNDGRLQAAVEKFQCQVIVKHAARERYPTSALVLQEPDLVRMRAPLLRLRDHLEGIRKMKAELKVIDGRIAEYLNEVDNEREQVYNSIELLESLMEKSQTQLKDIIDELSQWRRSSPVHELRIKYIRAPNTKHRMEYYPELAKTQQSLPGRFRSRSQPGAPQEPLRGRHKSASASKDSDLSQTSTDKRSKSTQRSSTQLSVMTQIGCESKEFGNQVDNVMLRTLDSEPNAYISPEDDSLQHYTPSSRQYVYCASQCRFSDAQARTAVQQVNVCTQQGIMKRDQASSPTRDSSGDCAQCQQPTHVEPGKIRRSAGGYYYDVADTLCSATEMQSVSEFCPISEAPSVPSATGFVCKRLQVGYPSLTSKENLYTQVDVYKKSEEVEVGDTTRSGETMDMQALQKPNMNSYAQITVRPICDSLEAITQIGVIQSHRASSPHRQLSIIRAASESNLLSAEMATHSDKRTVRAQAGFPTLTNQSSASTAIFSKSMELIPDLAETSTQNGPIVTNTFAQTTEPLLSATSEREKEAVCKQTQMGYSRSGALCDSYAQVGRMYKQTEIQTSPTHQLLIQPESQSLVQAPLPDDVGLPAEIRESSTQIGAVVTHARLSPIIIEPSAESKRIQVGQPSTHSQMHSWMQCSVIASDKSCLTDAVATSKNLMVNKKFQAVPPAFDSEVQVGRYGSSNAAQTLEVHAPQAVVVKLPQMASTGVQAVPVYHGKKLQVSVELALPETATMLMPTRQEPVFAPAALMQEAGCECKPAMQDSYCLVKLRPLIYDVQVQTAPILPPVVQTQGKKFQVDVIVSAESTPKVSTLVQTAHPSVQDSAADPYPGNEFFDAGIQASTPEPDVVRAAAAPLFHSAPPAQKVQYADTGCDVVSGPELTDAFVQAGPVAEVKALTFGKKLQVYMTRLRFVGCQTPGSLQISTPEPEFIHPEAASVVHSAPPAQKVQYADTGCDVVSGPALNDAFVQDGLVAEVKAPMYGKKLQVSMTRLHFLGCQTEGSLQNLTPEPEVIRAEPAPVVRSAPPAQKVHYADTGCDVVSGPALNDAFVQADQAAEIKAPVFGKKLQVSVTHLRILHCQTEGRLDISTPELEIVRAEPAPVVRSAPPAQRVSYADTGCDVVSGPQMNDAFVQADPVAEVNAPMIGKKLQVSITPLCGHGCRIESSLQSSTPEQEVIRTAAAPVVHSAPPVQYADKGCDVVSGPQMNDAFVQANRVTEVKAPMIGKKLQVSVTHLRILHCQTEGRLDISTPEPEFIRAEPAPVVRSVPPIQRVPYADTGSDVVSGPQMNDAFVQADPVAEVKEPMIAKKLQVSMTQLHIHGCQTDDRLDISTPEPEVLHAKVVPVVNSAPPAQRVPYADTGCDVVSGPQTNDAFVQADPVAEVKEPMIAKKLQVSVTQLHKHGCQTDGRLDFSTPEPEVLHANFVPVVNSAPPAQRVPYADTGCDVVSGPQMNDAFVQADPVAEVKEPMIAKELQVFMTQLHIHGCQTDISLQPQLTSCGVQMEAITELASVITSFDTPIVKSVPPLSAGIHEDIGCDASSGTLYCDVFTQAVVPLQTATCQSETKTQTTYVYLAAQCVNRGSFDLAETSKTLNLPGDCLTFGKTQTVTPFYAVQSTQVATKIEQVTTEPLHFTACQTRLFDYVGSRPRLQNDMWVQAELPAKRLSCRGVRIQASLPTTAPKLEVQKRDEFVQSSPVVMVGTTQTFDQEGTPAIKMVQQTTVETAPSRKPIDEDNIFTFTRETVARVTRSSSRSSSKLVPYKPQGFTSPTHMSTSMPTQLNVIDGGGDTSYPSTGHLIYQQVPASSHLHLRYITRLRSPLSRSIQARRNRSVEHIDGYEVCVTRYMHRNFVSNHELHTGHAYQHFTQHAGFPQYEVEQKCAATLETYVRRLGYETVNDILVDVARTLELEEPEVNIRSKRPRLQAARTQCTSTTSLTNASPSCYFHSPSAFTERSYNTDKSVQEGNSFVRWTPLASGKQVSIVYQSELSVAEENLFCFGKEGADRQLVGWVRKAEPLNKYQSEAVPPARQETSYSGEFMKSPALAAYCSDAELQESGIKTNYSAYDAFTLVAWQANDERLKLSTPGRLLKLTVVGARLSGSGKIISAADAFYRGILRIVYFDEESSTGFSLPAAISTGQVIVEKHYPPGVGIALRGDQDRCPVESEVIWTTPDLRHRSYRVKYIRKSETEKIDVRTALDEGIIDRSSGEIVNITVGPSTSRGQPIHEARESSVGSGDSVQRTQQPGRFNINEALFNGILEVEFDGQEMTAPMTSTKEATQAYHVRKSGSGYSSDVDI